MSNQAVLALRAPADAPSSRGECWGLTLLREETRHPAAFADAISSPGAPRALIETAAAGGPDGTAAFSRLVDLYRARVVSMIAGLLGDADQAEDVAQDAFLKVHAGLARFRFESRFESWLFRIAYRTAVDHTRRFWWRRRVSFEGMAGPRRDSALSGESGAGHPAAPPDPETELLRAEQARLVRKALAEIPLAFRGPVILKDLADLPYEEIGRILDCPLGTVESRIHRGRLALRKKLEKVIR